MPHSVCLNMIKVLKGERIQDMPFRAQDQQVQSLAEQTPEQDPKNQMQSFPQLLEAPVSHFEL